MSEGKILGGSGKSVAVGVAETVGLANGLAASVGASVAPGTSVGPVRVAGSVSLVLVGKGDVSVGREGGAWAVCPTCRILVPSILAVVSAAKPARPLLRSARARTTTMRKTTTTALAMMYTKVEHPI